MHADVIIIGAGPTGLCLAIALAQAGLKSIVLERLALTAIAQPAFDGREIALTHESRHLLHQWGIWDRIHPNDVSDLRHAQVLDGPASSGMTIHAELGQKKQLGWLVPNHVLRQAAYDSMAQQDRVQLITDALIERTQVHANYAEVGLSNGQTLRAPLLVAADSRFSETRRAMGIQAHVRDFGKSMMVFRVKHSQPYHHIAWEWFGYGQTRALLPLNDQCASVVLTLNPSSMQQLLALPAEEFDTNISERYEFRLGAMQRISERFVYPLVGVYATQFHAHRFALIGDAAVGMHPVTAHGFNLGVGSVAGLAQHVIAAYRAGQDLADPKRLAAYTRQHHQRCLPLFAATNLVVSLYTNDLPPVRAVRQAILKAANSLTPFKRFIATRLTG
ncbi:MAG TPA: 5-demethoxyubiquinol-8 5-hydroxylase UbiM [Paenalcaligenes hominis]|uniref:5-demethoxyubiquinol-8 5-hydroxylase UbiM n=1 Tax=Paenalcaligenes hominis TaxID=643674 RepID=A0A9D2VH05_9BURK|nr:5-demethoxyubiquinol-8 5-hydroxylase UbiM [Paenalcaligenes hominis]